MCRRQRPVAISFRATRPRAAFFSIFFLFLREPANVRATAGVVGDPEGGGQMPNKG